MSRYIQLNLNISNKITFDAYLNILSMKSNAF